MLPELPQSQKVPQTVTQKDPKRKEHDYQSATMLGPAGLADCAERFESARPLLARELGRAGSEAQFVLDFDPLKSPR